MHKKRWIIITAVVLAVALLWLLWGNLTVGLTEISLEDKGLPGNFNGFKIAHVSDLHNSHLWKQVIEKLQKAKPDIICITGDIVDCSKTDLSPTVDFVKAAMQIAPCYYVTGNHELNLDSAAYERLIGGLKAMGVTVLENETVTIRRGDHQIHLIGVPWDSSLYEGEAAQLDAYRILLSHAPEQFDSYVEAGFDLVLAGHAHGGQFRLPLLGGLYAPGQGVFPKYDSGIFAIGRTDMVVSRGIGNSVIPVRFANRPEVILIVLKA
jgi:predicted MPP superfamily phosphohydrolase